jgi:DNA-directed RNA polymerase subunit K/omega
MESDEDDITLETEDVIENDNDNDNEIDVMREVDEEETLDDNECIDIGETPELNITDTISVVDSNKRTSKNKLTRYEFVRIIGERVMQLTKGAKPLIKKSKESEEFTYKEIAIEELKTNMIPFKIRRFVKDHYEIWKIEELNKKHLEPLFF